MNSPKFYITQLGKLEVKDLIPFLQENWKILDNFFKGTQILNGEFEHFEIINTAAVTNFRFYHNLKFQPKDLISTFTTEGVSVTWKYDTFNVDYIEVTTDGSATLRGFLGRYEKT